MLLFLDQQIIYPTGMAVPACDSTASYLFITMIFINMLHSKRNDYIF
jgi:hypothetical protein